jgi:hypothetical protein
MDFVIAVSLMRLFLLDHFLTSNPYEDTVRLQLQRETATYRGCKDYGDGAEALIDLRMPRELPEDVVLPESGNP